MHSECDRTSSSSNRSIISRAGSGNSEGGGNSGSKSSSSSGSSGSSGGRSRVSNIKGVDAKQDSEPENKTGNVTNETFT